MERAGRDRRIEDCPDRWNDFEVRARLEYSVVSEDAFGQRAMVKLNVTPVIPSLIHKPLFRGR
jgi:hypothetical protein